MSGRVALRNLGCRLNRVELDRIGDQLLDSGCLLVDEQDADVVVINSCAVTGEAETKCRKAVRQALSLARKPQVVVTGCMAALSAQTLEELGERVCVVANKDEVAHTVCSLVSEYSQKYVPKDDQRNPLEASSEHLLTATGRTRHGVKIQDGCNNRCTFCVVWKARGVARSVPAEAVLQEVRTAVAAGSSEVVLSGVNLGSWSGEYGGQTWRLPQLLTYLLDRSTVGRLRLSSIEPPDVDGELVEVMAASQGRIAPFLHMCLQAGSDRTLWRMGRVYDTASYRERVRIAREALPDLALGCDLIVGFPGEREEDFKQSYEFCAEMGFANMHIFRFSARPGTPAAGMQDQVNPLVVAERSERMRQLAKQMRTAYAASRVGKDELVLVQEPGRGVSGGLLEVLVDDSLPVGSLATVRPVRVGKGALLDARESAEG